MLAAFVIVVLLLVAGAEGVLLFRAARRLIEYDDIFQQITPILDEYSEDLKKLSGGDLLIDSPEVSSFHRRNVQASKAIESVVDSVVSMTPGRKKKPPAPPRPDVE